MNFRTRVDFTNRQAKQYEKTNINLSGGTVFGLPYSALTSGPDLTFTGITFSNPILQSTYSGNTGTTVYTFGDSRMSIDEGDLSALTPSNSATTQYAGPTWIGYDMFTTVDGYTGWTSYSAVTYDLDVVTMVDLGGGSYSGLVESDFIVYSAASVDYTGSTIWVDVSGITRTDELIISKNPTIGYVLTCVDAQGKASWEPTSGSTSGSTFWEETGVGNTALKDNKGSHSITGVSTNSIIAGGSDNELISSTFSVIAGGSGNTVDSSTVAGIFAGFDSILEGTTSAIIGGVGHTLGPLATTDSVILGGISNIINGSGGYSFGNGIIGGQNHVINGRVSNNLLGGGSGHTVTGERLAVIGGTGHVIGDNDSFIGGGRFNQSLGNFSIILGGERNTNNSNNTSIISSTDSNINQFKTTIIGSDSSTISGGSATDSVNSIILGGKNNFIDKSTYSAIIGGTGNTITSGTTNSIILGGNAITGTSADMVYVPNISIVNINSGTSVSNLGVDATGKIIEVTKEVYYSALGLNNGTIGRYYGYTCNGGTDPVYVNGKWPSDFNSIISVEAIVIPTFSGTEITQLDCQYGPIGTVFSAITNSTTISPTYVKEEYTSLDVSSVFSAITTGDVFGFEIFQNNTDLFVLGLNVKYT